MLIKFRSCSSDFSQIPPRCSWKIVVLDVISQIDVQNIPWTNVVISFKSFNNFVVFSKDMNSSRVSSDWKQGNSQKIKESIDAPVSIYKVVSAGNNNDIHKFILGDFPLHGENRSKCIEKSHESPEEPFEENILAGLWLSHCWKIRIFIFLAQIIMMVSMILPERQSRWHSLRDVAHYCHYFVYCHVLVASKVNEVVNQAMEGMSVSSTQNIQNCEIDW